MVLSRDEVGRILKSLTSVPWIIVALLYGAGLRLRDGLELRVKDVDFDLSQIVIRRRKGQKDRRTMLPALVKERLRAHLADVKQAASFRSSNSSSPRRHAKNALPYDQLVVIRGFR